MPRQQGGEEDMEKKETGWRTGQEIMGIVGRNSTGVCDIKMGPVLVWWKKQLDLRRLQTATSSPSDLGHSTQIL